MDEQLNIVLCFDGTGDWVAKRSTNVAKVFDYVERSDRQMVYYDGGIGTLTDHGKLTRTGKALMRVSDLTLGTGLREKALGGYRFLMHNFREGAPIYLIGFSRGAYTARVLAGMIHQFGLLRPQHENLAHYLWDAISDYKLRSQLHSTAMEIRSRFSRDVNIHFMGLFDTVSSIGVLQRFKTFPGADRNASIRIIRHAISIHEKRNCFPECLMEKLAPETEKEQDLLQVWFPGVHREIGGGDSEEESGLSNIPLKWIAEQVAKNGLSINLQALYERIAKANPPKLRQPGFDWYVFAGVYPMFMLDPRVKPNDYDDPYDRHRYFWPNATSERHIPEKSLVYDGARAESDIAVVEETPKNIPKRVVWLDQNGISQRGERVKSDFRWFAADLLVTSSVMGVLALILDSLFLNRMEYAKFGPPVWLGVHDFLSQLESWFVRFVNENLYFIQLGEPQHKHIWLLWGIGILFLIFQAGGRKFVSADSSWPTVGIVVVASLLYLVYWQLPALCFGALAGIPVWAVSRLPPIVPAMHADRALPYVAIWWLRIALLGFFLAVVLRWFESGLSEPLMSVLGWLLLIVGALLLGWSFGMFVNWGIAMSLVPRRQRVEKMWREEYRALLKRSVTARRWMFVSAGVALLGVCIVFDFGAEPVLFISPLVMFISTAFAIVQIVGDRRRLIA